MKNLVANGDFSRNAKGFDSDYTHVNGAPGSDSNVTPSYDVDTSPANAANAYPDWADYGDHTTGTGRMMICNGDSGVDAWSEGIKLDAGKHYTFSLWARAIDDGSNGIGSSPQLQFLADGHAIGTALSIVGSSDEGWQHLTFNYSATATTSSVSIQDLTGGFPYNDFALDDISITRGRGSSSADAIAAAPLDHHPAFAAALHTIEHLAIA